MFYSKKINRIPGIKSFFFSRKNGVSKGIYKSLNCGLGSSDQKILVKNNIKIVAKKTGCKLNNLVLLRQYHSSKVIDFDNQLISVNYRNASSVIHFIIMRRSSVAEKVFIITISVFINVLNISIEDS